MLVDDVIRVPVLPNLAKFDYFDRVNRAVEVCGGGQSPSIAVERGDASGLVLRDECGPDHWSD